MQSDLRGWGEKSIRTFRRSRSLMSPLIGGSCADAPDPSAPCDASATGVGSSDAAWGPRAQHCAAASAGDLVAVESARLSRCNERTRTQGSARRFPTPAAGGQDDLRRAPRLAYNIPGIEWHRNHDAHGANRRVHGAWDNSSGVPFKTGHRPLKLRPSSRPERPQ